MKFAYAFVSAPDERCTLGRLYKTEGGSFGWDNKDKDDPTTHATLAWEQEDRKLAGIHKYDIQTKANGEVLLKTHATYVWPNYREEGLALKLWARSLRAHAVTHVRVSVISDRGRTLVESLQRRYPGVTFMLKVACNCKTPNAAPGHVTCANARCGGYVGKRQLRSLKGKMKRAA